MAQQIDTVVIGGGQAGLAVSYYLTQQGREHVVLEQAPRVADAWRNGRWDSFTLVIPNWSVRMPGLPYSGDDPDGFMSRIDIVDYLEQYALSFAAPVRFEVRVTAVDPALDGMGYLLSTAEGAAYEAANVIVATGSFQFPKPSPLACRFPGHILQLHSSQYRNPDVLPPGAVLVVGSADSGAQIAEELQESGRQVYLCVGKAGRRPRRYRGKDSFFWAVRLGRLAQTVDQLPSPAARFAANVQLTGKNGGYSLNLHQFSQRGMVLLGHLTGANGNIITLAPDLRDNLAAADKTSDDFKGAVDALVQRTGMNVPDAEVDELDIIRSSAGENSPATLDLQEAGISVVIWANGYGFDYNWVNLPVLDDWGYPIQQRGVTEFPGLYFVGMNLLYNRGSGILFGVGEDAAHVAAHIAAR